MGRRKKGSETTDARNTISIALSARANAVLNHWLELNDGWGKAKFVQTLIERFSAMPESVQAMFVGHVPADMREDFLAKAEAYFRIVIESAPSLGGVPPDAATPKPVAYVLPDSGRNPPPASHGRKP